MKYILGCSRVASARFVPVFVYLPKNKEQEQRIFKLRIYCKYNIEYFRYSEACFRINAYKSYTLLYKVIIFLQTSVSDKQ